MFFFEQVSANLQDAQTLDSLTEKRVRRRFEESITAWSVSELVGFELVTGQGVSARVFNSDCGKRNNTIWLLGS